MEDNGKDLRAAPSAPLFRLISLSSESFLALNLSKVLLYAVLWTLTLHFAALCTACYFHIDCGLFLPSPSYLTTYTHGSRWEIAAAVCYAGTVALVNRGAYVRLKGTTSKELREVLFGVGVAISLILPLLPAINDVNSGQGLLIERVHCFLYYSLLILLVVWLNTLVYCVSLLKTGFNRSETAWFYRLQWAIRLLMALVGVMLFQWKFAYTSKARFFLNEWALEASGWVLSALIIALPALLAQLFRGFCVYFPVNTTTVAADP